MWKTHINDFIWVANREARNLMEQGLVAPDTGRKENNKGLIYVSGETPCMRFRSSARPSSLH